jgi:hypothetical protein
VVANVVNENSSSGVPPTQADVGSRSLPREVAIEGAPSFSPNELRVLKAMTGSTLEAIMNDEVDAVQAMVWLSLRDLGYTPTWDEAGNVRGRMVEVPVDPSIGGDSTMSPPSAASGG